MIHSCPKCNEFYETNYLLNYVHRQLHNQVVEDKDAEITRLRRALKATKGYIQELQEDAMGCDFCSDEAPCFTCSMLLSASDTISKAMKGE